MELALSCIYNYNFDGAVLSSPLSCVYHDQIEAETPPDSFQIHYKHCACGFHICSTYIKWEECEGLYVGLCPNLQKWECMDMHYSYK